MAVFRVEKTKNYTVMANYHLQDIKLSLKAKGLLSMMLSLPENWDYTAKGLTKICKDEIDGVDTTIKELEKAKYITRRRIRNSKGQLTVTEYTIYEQPQVDCSELSIVEIPKQENPRLDKPTQEKPVQLNTNELNTEIINTSLLSTKELKNEMNRIDFMTIEEIRELVLRNIEYEHFKLYKRNNIDSKRLDEIVELMVETLSSTKETINISGNKIPSRYVRYKLL